MIPLRDDVPSRSIPFMNIALIAINVFAFIYEIGMGVGLERFFQEAAVIPRLYAGEDGRLGLIDAASSVASGDLSKRVLASMFLHGGWLHILGNMLYLWIFGDNVEDRMGHVRYLIFYLLCGWTASYAHILSQPDSIVPSIGASGAIAGVLGAYMTLYPRARVVTLIPLGFFTQLVRVPALLFLGFWFLQQFLSGALSLTARTAETGGVAWWAHIGGFAAGVTLVWLFQKPRRRPTRRDAWWNERPRARRLRAGP
ncbi:MAG: rhomboid family intramembrane serine protease [Vicinamibacteria bacterium]|nr:rhomboid family intramembrane serine protease [Vicinamibacteria bacterium]